MWVQGNVCQEDQEQGGEEPRLEGEVCMGGAGGGPPREGPPSGQDQPRGCGGPTGRLGGGAPDASLVVPVRMSVAPGLPVPPRTPDAAERRGAVCTTLPAACFIDGETETWAEEAVRAESHSCGLERVPRARSSV